MRAAWFEKTGAPRDVLHVGEMPDPEPGPGEVRVRVRVSAVNPGDTKKRDGTLGPIAFRRVTPHSDGSGVIDKVGAGVAASRVGERVWIFNAQSGRPFGTAAELTCVPDAFAVLLADDVDFITGAGLGIPARTAHQVVFRAGPVRGKSVLVAGGAGSVGKCAVEFARWGGAHVIATVGGPEQAKIVRACGAELVLDYKKYDVAAAVMEHTRGHGVDHIVEVDLGRNAKLDASILAMKGTIAAYATSGFDASVPFWAFVFRYATVHFIGCDSVEAMQTEGVKDIGTCVAEGLLRPIVAEKVKLDDIVHAHEVVDRGGTLGKVFVEIA